MLLVIAIVGTTIAPCSSFQQRYVIDKRITPRFMRDERIDLWLGIVLVVIGAAAMRPSPRRLRRTARIRQFHRRRRRRRGP